MVKLQVPLGVQLHDESRLDEMCAIMDGLHRYVPQVAVTRSVMASGGVEQYSDCELSAVLFGGDQLTAAKARGAKALRSNE